MTRVIVLDAGPLGLAVTEAKPETEQATNWIANLLLQGNIVVIPEVADYEVRLELLRADKQRGIVRLDALASLYGTIRLQRKLCAGRQRFGHKHADKEQVLPVITA